MTRYLIMLALLCVASTAQAGDYAALFEEASAAIVWDLEGQWAFTETRLSDDTLWVSRFDPRRDENERWTLLSVDGRAPTDSELREFAADKDDYRTAATSQRLDLVGLDTLELVDEDDESLLLRFVPNEDEIEFVENVDGSALIMKTGPYLRHIDLRNSADIKPGFGMKIGTFRVRLEFGPAVVNGPIVPRSMKIQVGGRMLLFIGFEETEVIEFSDFEAVAKDTAQ